MNGQQLVREIQHDHLEEVARPIRADGQEARWVGLWFEVHHHDGVVQGVAYVLVGNSMAPGRPMDVHTRIVYYISCSNPQRVPEGAWGRAGRRAEAENPGRSGQSHPAGGEDQV